jgi:quercetin dioxygenase-like cupin family protein
VHVLEGSITVEVDDQVIALEVGDAIAFPGDVDHAYANPNDKPARFSLAVFEPGVGGASTPTETHRG